jgi:uncharacterized Zn finger protein (UPF0148 family)
LYKDEQAKFARLREVEQFLVMFAESGEAACPTCGTPSTQMSAQIELRETEQARLKTKVEELGAGALRQKTLESRWQTWEKKQAELDAAEKQIDSAEQELLAVPAPALSEEESAQTVADYDSFQKALGELQPHADALKLKLATMAGNLTGLVNRAEGLQQQIDDCQATEADAHAAVSG